MSLVFRLYIRLSHKSRKMSERFSSGKSEIDPARNPPHELRKTIGLVSISDYTQAPAVEFKPIDLSKWDGSQVASGRRGVLVIDGVEFPFRYCQRGKIKVW